MNYCHFSQTRKLNCVSVFVLPLTTHNWGLEWTIVLCAAVQLLISFSLSVKYCCYFDWFSVCKFLAKTLPGMIFECKSYLVLLIFPILSYEILLCLCKKQLNVTFVDPLFGCYCLQVERFASFWNRVLFVHFPWGVFVWFRHYCFRLVFFIKWKFCKLFFYSNTTCNTRAS